MTKTVTAAKKADEASDTVAPKPAPLLSSETWARDGVKFGTHEAVPPAGTSLEALLDPSYWGNVAKRLKPGDTIIVFPRDGAYYAELLVWDAGQNWAQVEPKLKLARPPLASAPGVEDQFEVRRDPIDGYVVVRKDTGAKVKGGFGDAEDARKWILQHQRALRS